MIVERSGDSSSAYGGNFTGSVRLEMLAPAAAPSDADVARVHFGTGVVTAWHSHPGGQVLVLLSGVGRVGSGEEGHAGLEPGTFATTPVDEPHWHGADAGHEAVWLAITYGATSWTGDVPAPAQEPG